MSTASDRMKSFFDEILEDPAEERVLEYVVREMRKGRRIMEVIEDPYVRNRLNETKRDELLQNPEIMETLDAEIRAAFEEGLESIE